MAHLAFVAPPFLGHLNPMAALARALEARGHRATFLQMADAGAVLAPGLAFRAVGSSTHPAGSLAAITRRMARVNGFLGLSGIIRDVADATATLCRDLPTALREIGADMIVCDQAEAAGGLVAGHLGLPFVSVANALPLNREPAVPPPFTDWRYNPSPWGLERNRGGYRVSDLLMRRHAGVISDHAARWRLGALSRIEDCLSPLAEISQLVPGLDMPRRALPATFHYCGPLRDAAAAPAGFRMPPPDGRPLAYASLGTLQGSRVRLFRRIAEAARLAGLQLVVAHGGRLGAREAASLAGAPAVFDFVPQQAVLGQAAVAILNGGLNTVLDAFAEGVPVAILPIAFEQGAIGARVERAGAGLVVSRRFLGAGRLARAANRLVAEPGFRAGAARLRAEIAAAGGVGTAADIVERVLATGRPVLRADVASQAPRRTERAA